MKTDHGPHSPLACALAALAVPALSSALRARALARARANLVPPAEARPRSLLRALPALAPSAALLSADAAFVADLCLKLGRIH
jgi:hypothetical protein